MKFFEFIQKALSEDNGNPSSIRLMSFIGFMQWSIAITVGFVVVLIYQKDLIIPYLYTVAAMTAGILGIKVWQKGKEAGSPQDPPEAS